MLSQHTSSLVQDRLCALIKLAAFTVHAARLMLMILQLTQHLMPC